MPTSPPRHGQQRVEAGRKANQKEYNKTQRTGGDFYNSGRWRNVRKQYIRENPICIDCRNSGQIVEAQMVDHIVPIKDGGAKLQMDNLQSLCNFHHGQKTSREREQVKMAAGIKKKRGST